MALDLKKAFELAEDEYVKFDRIQNPNSKRPDICAYLLLDNLNPGSSGIIASSEHDTIYLDTDLEALAEKATQEDIVFLARCGVMLNSEYDCLYMFV